MKECQRHSCNIKKNLKRCKYCKRLFCKEHIKAKVPTMPKFKSSDPQDLLLMEEWRKPGGHPCFPYLPIWEEKIEKIKQEEYQAIKNLLDRPSKLPIKDTWKETVKIVKPPISTTKEIKEEKPIKERPQKEPKQEKPKIKIGPISFVLLIIAIFLIIFFVLGDTLGADTTSFEIFELVNEFRNSNNLSAIKYNNNAYELAKNISEKAHNNHFFKDYSKLALDFNVSDFTIITGYLHDTKNIEVLMDSQWKIVIKDRDKILNESNREGAVGCFENHCSLVLIKKDKHKFWSFLGESAKKESVDSAPSSKPPSDNGFVSEFTDTISDMATHKIDISSTENQINNLINQERAKAGLHPLNLDGKTSNVARKHSQDQIDNHFFDHVNLQGQDPTGRALEMGVNCYKDYGSYYTEGFAENIANAPFGSVIGCGYVYDEESIAKCLVSGWMESPGHRENILTSAYDRTGIGIACDFSECIGTQMFC